MKIIKAVLLCLFIISGCGKQDDKPGATAKVEGVFSGVIPCPECDGINYILTLNADSTFNETMTYLYKDINTTESSVADGRWDIDEDNIITLNGKSGVIDKLEYSEGNLHILSPSGEKYAGTLADQYVLKPDVTGNPGTKSSEELSTSAGTGSINGKWTVLEINGIKPDSASYIGDKPYLDFRVADNKFTGSTGCNRINGASTISGNYITFSKYITTKMACPGDIESNFINALKSIDSYEALGNTLMLKSSGKTVLLLTK